MEGNMEFAGFLPKKALSVGMVVLGAAGLSGCFDLAQRVAVRHDGSGTYATEITADGFLGKELDKKGSDINVGDEDDNAVRHTVRRGDSTTETSEVSFHQLSDLKLGDDQMSLHVLGTKPALEGATEVSFHRSFQVDHARHRHDDGDDKDHVGRSILESMFGDHTYQFSIWLPGKIERIAPIKVGDQVVQPVVWGDATGHTITWKIPLSDVFLADTIDFDVDFAAKGDFHDAVTRESERRHHRHHDDT
jgi:hypothetical protein